MIGGFVNRKSNYKTAIMLLLMMLGAEGCVALQSSPTPAFDPTRFARTAEAQLTGIAATLVNVNASLTQTTVAPFPSSLTVTPEGGRTPTLNDTEIPCNRAGAGTILDVTYPDDSRLLPGQPFTKVWRLVNRGSCTWTRDYQVVWFSGDRLGTSPAQPLPGKVEPAESVDIAVDMIAPQQPGLYTSYWMLRNPEGELFGIGPEGNAPFWVRIQVIAAYTSTPTATPTLTPTPVVAVSGRIDVAVGEGVDLDEGEVTNETGADFIITQLNDGSLWIEVVEGGGMMIFGEGQPTLNDCRSAVFSENRIGLEKITETVYFCYLTDEGLSGYLRPISINPQPFTLQFEYVTWLTQ